MKFFWGLLALILFAFGCHKDKETRLDNYFAAEIVSFDLNCSTCILKFPNDSITIRKEIGRSTNNFYQTINLLSDTFKIGHRISVKLRKAVNNDIRICRTLYPSYNYTNIFILDIKK